MYALEALTQLVVYRAGDKQHHLLACNLRIEDSPRFPWRGVRA